MEENVKHVSSKRFDNNIRCNPSLAFYVLLFLSMQDDCISICYRGCWTKNITSVRQTYTIVYIIYRRKINSSREANFTLLHCSQFRTLHSCENIYTPSVKVSDTIHRTTYRSRTIHSCENYLTPSVKVSDPSHKNVQLPICLGLRHQSIKQKMLKMFYISKRS